VRAVGREHLRLDSRTRCYSKLGGRRRYRCQALLDDGAVLACMAYVDLNPVRAGIADDLPSSAHTSVRARLVRPGTEATQPIEPIAGPSIVGFLPLNEQQYIALVDWAGRRLHPGKRGVITRAAPSPLPLRVDQEAWLEQVRGIESRFCRAVGSVQALLDRAREMGQRWLMVRRLERVA